MDFTSARPNRVLSGPNYRFSSPDSTSGSSLFTVIPTAETSLKCMDHCGCSFISLGTSPWRLGDMDWCANKGKLSPRTKTNLELACFFSFGRFGLEFLRSDKPAVLMLNSLGPCYLRPCSSTLPMTLRNGMSLFLRPNRFLTCVEFAFEAGFLCFGYTVWNFMYCERFSDFSWASGEGTGTG